MGAPPGLGGPQHVALAARLEVQPGELEPVGGRGDRVEPVPGRAGERGLGHQQAQPRRRPPADPAAQLVQLGDPEAVRVEHHHHGGVRHVHAHLDHGGGDEHVGLPGGEAPHHRVLVLGGHAARAAPPAAARQRALGQQRRDLEHRGGRAAGRLVVGGGVRAVGEVGGLGVADAGADDEGLVAGGDLLADPRPGPVDPAGLLRHRHDGGPDGRAAARELRAALDDLQVAEDGHRDRARDRGGGHDEHVRGHRFGRRAALGPQGVALLHPEAVLLVDHHQPQVGEDCTRSSSSACVPTTIPALPSAIRRASPGGRPPPASRSAARPGWRARRGVELAGPAERPRAARARPRACWVASTSVGASSAAWPPESTTASIARSATTVLPEPTSPCSSRCIGLGRASSAAHLAPISRLPGGQGERQGGVEGGEQPRRGAGPHGRPGSRAAAARRRASTSWSISASS